MLDRVDGGGILPSSSPAEQVLGQSLVLFINHVYTITFNLGEEEGGKGQFVVFCLPLFDLNFLIIMWYSAF